MIASISLPQPIPERPLIVINGIPVTYGEVWIMGDLFFLISKDGERVLCAYNASVNSRKRPSGRELLSVHSERVAQISTRHSFVPDYTTIGYDMVFSQVKPLVRGG